jgi:hypothetical protein
MLTTNSIDPSVTDFFFLIDRFDHRSQNPCQTDDHRSIGSHSINGIYCIHQSKIGSPTPIFLKEGKTSKYSSIICCAKYDGLTLLCRDEENIYLDDFDVKLRKKLLCTLFLKKYIFLQKRKTNLF